MPKNFKTGYYKRTENLDNILVSPKRMVKSQELDESRKKNLIEWITFYRRNMHRFVEHYLGIELYFYQKIWIYYM